MACISSLDRIAECDQHRTGEEKPVYNSHFNTVDLLVALGIRVAYLLQSHDPYDGSED